MNTIEKIPTSALELREMFEEQSEIRISASLEDFYQIASELDYKIQFHQSEIIIFDMGKASELHELLAANMIGLLFIIFRNSNYKVYGSNRSVYISACQSAFEPDVVVVSGKNETVKYRSGDKVYEGLTNPAIIVEVLSKSTRQFDLSEKLDCYKQINSLETIIFIDQAKVSVSVYQRTAQQNEWLNSDYQSLTQHLNLKNTPVYLSDIYLKTELS
ncbi:MAG: Uma2 family endonuclease [Microscillaceae bacterium]|jgi:Uma2 family endonuclease|nr:Uma2 family endonuclease [Microscillaceae bacterium]